HQALGVDMYLRIAPETYLKRLVVGGYERVYEFARCFRNEGLDPTHLQDFTMLEYYVAYWDYRDNMKFTEKLLKAAIEEVTGGLKIEFGGHEIDLDGDWPSVDLFDGLQKECGLDRKALEDLDTLKKAARDRGVADEELSTLGRVGLIDVLFKKALRPAMIRPTFLTGHPIEISPLARRSSEDPGVADRFQLVIGGWEIVNAYSELIDPLEQRRRLEEQARGRDDETMVKEEDYLLAMEYGLPPTSGFGLGIDRLVALVSGNENLRDVVLFPLMRPEDS
ncbi:MAG: lysine--tRNA ligase, partial [Planctomycetota bacterium]|nr:lysine--tRNA ligase [Planctomycetota bacterium]